MKKFGRVGFSFSNCGPRSFGQRIFKDVPTTRCLGLTSMRDRSSDWAHAMVIGTNNNLSATQAGFEIEFRPAFLLRREFNGTNVKFTCYSGSFIF